MPNSNNMKQLNYEPTPEERGKGVRFGRIRRITGY